MSGKKGADWYDESDRDKMNMLSACAGGMCAEVERYLTSGGVDVEEEDDDGVTALQIAAAKGHRNLVELLIRKGAQMDRANYAGMTPFLHACREGHQDVVTMLANHGANIHLTTGLGVTAITLACAGRHIGVVRTLRGLNASVNVVQCSRSHQIAPSPFMVAFFQMDIEICGFLKKNDADVLHQIRWLDCLDVNLLGEALKFPHFLMGLIYAEHSLKAPKRTKDIRMVIQSGSELELDAWIREGMVPTSLADGVTPLMYAAVHGQHRMAEKMLESARLQVAVDAQENVLGLSALMFAIVVADSAMVQLLLRCGANPRLRTTTKEPFSALELAHFAGLNQESLIKLYKQYVKCGKGPILGTSPAKNESPGERAETGSAKMQLAERKSSPATGGGALMMARLSGSGGSLSGGAGNQNRLRRAIESISRNIRGYADEQFGQLSLDAPLMLSEFGVTPRARFDAHADCVLLFAQDAPRFLLAEQILRGDARSPCAIGTLRARQQPDTLIALARYTAISWVSRGDTVRLAIFDESAKLLSLNNFSGESNESNGLYLAAQRNADKLTKNKTLKHRRRKTEPTIAQIHQQAQKVATRMPMTPQLRMAGNGNQREIQQSQKSPSSVSRHKVSNQSDRTAVRKAPHRLSQQQQNQQSHSQHGHHQRAASSGSAGNGSSGNGGGIAGGSGGSQSESSPQATLSEGTTNKHQVGGANSKQHGAPSRPSLFRVQYHHNQNQNPQHSQSVPGSPVAEQHHLHQQPKLYNKRRNSKQSNQQQQQRMEEHNLRAQHNHHHHLSMAQPQMAKPLTKELIQQKVREWGLTDEFEECFVAEEVDELTFASLRDSEVREVLAKHGRADQPALCLRFLELIGEIKRCTGCSELL